MTPLIESDNALRSALQHLQLAAHGLEKCQRKHHATLPDGKLQSLLMATVSVIGAERRVQDELDRPCVELAG